MAQRGLYTGVPTQEPTGAPAHDYQNIDAPASAFGGQIGQASQQLGGTLEQGGTQLSETALKSQTLFNEANTQAAQDKWMTAANSVLHDPKTGFYAQKEGNALSAYQPAIDALTQSRQAAKDALPNDRQRLMFDQLTRRIYDAQIQGMGRHVDTEATKFATGQLAGSIDSNIRAGSLAWNDDGPQSLFDYNLGQARAKTQNLGETMGWSQDQIDQKKAETTSKAWHARVSMAMDQDLPFAEKLLRENGDKLDPQLRASLQGQLQVKQYQAEQRDLPVQAQAIARKYLASGPTTTATPNAAGAVPVSAAIPVEQVGAAIQGQEYRGTGQSPTSVNGAVGNWQIMPETFKRYAKPGEVITNPADNSAVGRRIVSDLYQKFDGDPQRVAVGYFSGEGNVAPKDSPTPWLRDTVDGNGKSVSSYVNDVSARVGGLSKAGIKLDQATILAKVDQDFASNPKLGHYVAAEVQRQYSIANMAVSSQLSAEKEASDKAADTYVKQAIKGDPNPAVTLQKIADDPALDWRTREHLSNIVRAEANRDGAHDEKTYGSGYWDVFKGIHAPQGSPDRITDVSQIYALGGPGGKLTMAGIDKATAELNGKKTPEGVAAGKMKDATLAYIKHQLSFEMDYGYVKMRDPKGEDAFHVGALPAFYQAYEAGKKADKSDYQLLSKDSPDFIGDKIIAAFKRSPAQEAADKIGALNDMTGEKPAELDLTTIPGIVAARKAGKITKEEMEEAGRKAGFIKPLPTTAQQPAVPQLSVPIR